MSRFLVLNFQDFGLDHYIKDTIKSHTVFCVCCLAKDDRLIDLDKCKHASYLENFIRPEMDKYKNAICYNCHLMLQKIDIFRKQVEQSFFILNRDNFKINSTSSIRKPTLLTKRTVNIYLPPVRRQLMDTTERRSTRPVESVSPLYIDPLDVVPAVVNDGSTCVDLDKSREISQEPTPIPITPVPTITNNELPMPEPEQQKEPQRNVKREMVNVKMEPSETEDFTVTETELQPQTPQKKRVLVVTLTQEELNRERVSTAQSWGYLKYAHRCEHCLIGFMYEDNLRDHVERRHRAKLESITCEVCTQVIQPAGGINAHMFRHFTRYECEDCQKRFPLFNDALAHYRRAHENLSSGYKCKHCDYTTKHHHEFSLHKLRHQRHTCSDCGLLFTSRTGFKRHMIKVHKKNIYKCVTCRTSHDCMSSYVAHMKRHGNKPSCLDCNVSFKTWHSYSAHLQLSAAHNQKNRYRCTECGMRFVAAHYLRIHTEQRHKHVKPHVCTHCHKTFTLPIELKRHINKIHNEAQTKNIIVCDHCGKAYASRSHLINHINEAHNKQNAKKVVKKS